MTPVMCGIVGIIVLIILLFSKMPIGATMAFVGFFGFAALTSFEGALGILRVVPFSTFSNNGFTVIPLFVFMGALLFVAGMSEGLYKAAYTWFGAMRGGLAIATIVACALFAAISGSSLAAVATIGKVAIPEMRRYKYSEKLATGVIAAGGCMGILIPPSNILIVYGVITEQSIAKLFMAGMLPGVLQALMYVVVVMLITFRDPLAGPPGGRSTMLEKGKSFKYIWEVVILFLLVIGGIYSGQFTPTEAAAVGAFGALIFTAIRRKLTMKNFVIAVEDTVKTTGMLFVIIFGAMVFGYFLTKSRLPFQLSEFVSALAVSKYVILACILIVFLLLGCILDTMAIILLAVPIFYPLVINLGFDPIWFGILVVCTVEIGLITPPVGLNVYIIQGISGAAMSTCFRGITPFVIIDLTRIVILVTFPAISLFLPNLLF